MNGPPGSGFGLGVPGLPPGPVAYATGRSSQAGLRPGTGTTPVSPVSPLVPGQPLLGTPAPTSTASPSANMDGGACASGDRTAAAVPGVSIAGSMANVLGATGVPGSSSTGESPKGVQSGPQGPSRRRSSWHGHSDAIVRALTMAVSGEREVVPSGPGALGGGQPNPSKEMGS